MSSNIIKKGTADEVRCAVTELRLSETFMDVPQLSVKVVSSTPITFEIGDYITYDYNGVTYTLRSIPEAAKNARPSTYGEAFVYNLVFYSPMWDLRNAPFLDLVLYDNGQHFTSMPDVTTYEDVYGITARVQANMDNMYPGKWEIRVVSGLSADSTLAKRLSETQDFSLSDGKCLDALSQVYSQWGVSFVYSYESGKHVITIGGAETQEDTTGLFMYGRGNGLKVIKSSVQNASEIATRYYVYGGTQNMQPRYYNGRTMEPEYIHASDASNSTITGICSGRRLLGDNMYVPNLMIPVSKWGRSTWYVWTASSHSQAVFTEVRNPSAGDDFAFDEPNIGASRNVISSVSSGGIVVNGFTYQYLTEVLYPDIRKAYIDAPQSYLDKYGIRPATLRFDGSGEREDIHPSIKGLTVGDIRAGLGSSAEYYPSTSVYTDPDERVDRVLSCDNPQDDGLTSSGANKYETVLTASVEQAVRNIDMTLEEREEDDPQEGSVIYNYYRADNAVILGNAFSVTVPSKSNLDFIFPLRLSVGMQTAWTVNARVSIYRTDASGARSEVDSYERVLAGSGEAKDFNLAPSANSRYVVDAGEILSVDVVFTRVTADYSENVQPQFNVVIPAYTQQWRLAVSLGTEFYIKLRQIGFDISEVPTNDGESPVISMTSGQCGGYEFEIHDVSYNASDDSWTLRCARVQDGTLGQWFPNSIFGIEPDDTFVLLNIALPEVYITASEQRLYDAALAERLYEERPLLEPEIDSKVMAESPQVLRAGMWFSVKDTDLGLAGTDGGSYLILIDSVEVTDKPDTIRSFKVTLRNNKEDNVFVRMQRQIAQTSASVQSERRSQTKTSVSEVPTKGGGGGGLDETAMWSALGTSGTQQIDGSHITEALEDYVTLSTEQTVTARKTFAGDVVLGGQRQDGSYGRAFVPSHAGPGVYDLYISSEPIAGEIPSGSGGIDETELWSILGTSGTQQIDASHMSSALAGYATQQWVQQQGYLTSSALTPYATKEWVEQQGYLTEDDLGSLEGYVTLDTAQTVTGAKTFSALLTASGGISGSNADFSGYVSAAKLYVPSYNGNKVYDLYVSNEPIAGEAPSGSGGLDEAELWSILTDGGSGERIVRAHLPLDAVYEEDLSGFLTSVSLATISDLNAGWDVLLKAAPDFYSKAEVGELLAGYVTLATAQTVSGKKTFSALLTASGGISGSNADFSGYVSAAKLYVPSYSGNKVYDLYISNAPVSGEAPSGSSGIDEAELWSILTDNAGGERIVKSHLPLDTVYDADLSSALGSYLPLAGGTMSGDITMSGHSLIWAANTSINWDTVSGLQTMRSSDVTAGDPPGGYCVGVNIAAGGYKFQMASYIAGLQRLYFRGYDTYNATWDEWVTILHTSNIGSYALTKSNYSDTLDGRYLLKSTYTAADVLAKIKTVDGSGSGLDADLLDGQHASYWQSHVTNFLFKATYDVNTTDGWVCNNYNSANSWVNAPSGMGFGIVMPIIGEGTSLGAQLAFDISHNIATGTGSMWFRGRNNLGWATNWKKVVTDADIGYYNAGSATRLATPRTLWGQSFDGMQNVSGDMTGVGTITGNGFTLGTNELNLYDSTSKANRITANWSNGVARIYATNNAGNDYRDLSLGQTQGGSSALCFNASTANWGIGTTSPAYKLDVAGKIRATIGITIGSTDDIGWYYTTDSRICAGQTTARGVNVGSLLVSNLWNDYTKVPANGIYSKGNIWTGGRLYVPSSAGNQVYDLYISNAPVSGEAPSGIDETELWDILSDGGSGERIAKAHMPSDVLYTDDIQPDVTASRVRRTPRQS